MVTGYLVPQRRYKVGPIKYRYILMSALLTHPTGGRFPWSQANSPPKGYKLPVPFNVRTADSSDKGTLFMVYGTRENSSDPLKKAKKISTKREAAHLAEISHNATEIGKILKLKKKKLVQNENKTNQNKNQNQVPGAGCRDQASREVANPTGPANSR